VVSSGNPAEFSHMKGKSTKQKGPWDLIGNDWRRSDCGHFFNGRRDLTHLAIGSDSLTREIAAFAKSVWVAPSSLSFDRFPQHTIK
jgi:hypothetical protein